MFLDRSSKHPTRHPKLSGRQPNTKEQPNRPPTLFHVSEPFVNTSETMSETIEATTDPYGATIGTLEPNFAIGNDLRKLQNHIRHNCLS